MTPLTRSPYTAPPLARDLLEACPLIRERLSPELRARYSVQLTLLLEHSPLTTKELISCIHILEACRLFDEQVFYQIDPVTFNQSLKEKAPEFHEFLLSIHFQQLSKLVDLVEDHGFTIPILCHFLKLNALSQINDLFLLLYLGLTPAVCERHLPELVWALKKCIPPSDILLSFPPCSFIDKISLPPLERATLSKRIDSLEELFPSTPSSDLCTLFRELKEVSSSEKTEETLLYLAKLIKNGHKGFPLWHDPIFKEASIKPLLFLAYFAGFISLEDLETATTMVTAMSHFVKASKIFLVLPLFSQEGGLNPYPKRLLQQTQIFSSSTTWEIFLSRLEKKSPLNHYILLSSTDLSFLFSGSLGSSAFCLTRGNTWITPTIGIVRASLPESIEARFPPYPLIGQDLEPFLFRFFDWKVFNKHSIQLTTLLKQGATMEFLASILPPLFKSPTPPLQEFPSPLSSLEEFKEARFVKERLREANGGVLFQYIEEAPLEQIAQTLSRVAAADSTKNAILLLLSLLYTETYMPYFWTHPIFQKLDIDVYIMLAYLMGALPQGTDQGKTTLATLFTMTSSLSHYQKHGITPLSFPLFLECGSPHPLADELVSYSLRMHEKEKRQKWFDAVRQLPKLEHYFLYTPYVKTALSKRPKTIMNLIVEKFCNILYRTTPYHSLPTIAHVPNVCHFIPTIGASLECLKIISEGELPEMALHFGFGIPSIMRDEHKKGVRTLTLQSTFCKAQEFADGHEAPGAEITLHDLLYHFFIASYVPRSDMIFFMEFSESLQSLLPTVAPHLRGPLQEFIHLLIDAEFVYYHQETPFYLRQERDVALKKTILWSLFNNLVTFSSPSEHAQELHALIFSELLSFATHYQEVDATFPIALVQEALELVQIQKGEV